MTPTPHQLLIREWILQMKEGRVAGRPFQREVRRRPADRSSPNRSPTSSRPGTCRSTTAKSVLTRKGLLQVDSLLHRILRSRSTGKCGTLEATQPSTFTLLPPMPTLAEPQTLAELIDHLGVPPDRIRCQPPPGTATEADVIRLDARNVFCELIDGVLVEKAVGVSQSRVAALLIYFLYEFLESHGDLGVVYGSDAPHRFYGGQIRYPDVSFVRYERLPGREVPVAAIAAWAPNLAVEVISPSNTEREMELKLQLYFDSGVELVWYVYPDTREVHVYSSPDDSRVLGPEDELDGGTVLPGFRLSIEHWFTKAQATH